MKASILLLSVILSASPLAAETASRQGEVARSEAISLAGCQVKAYRAFKNRAAYHGAFFVNSETCRAFWVDGFHRLTTAKQAAEKYCTELSKGEGKCRLYAVSYPKGGSHMSSTSPLSQEAAEALNGTYMRKQKQGKHGAFAISGASQYGMTWGWDNAAEAREGALARCEAYVAKALAALNNEGRRWAKARGLDTCRIIHTSGPS